MVTMNSLLLILCSYGIGCCTCGYYLTRWRTGEDIRRLGSGGVGATNVGRTLGAAGFVVTFLFDFAKGAVVVAAVHQLQLSPPEATACVFAVVAGHIWPIQLRFQGGKGIATSLGAIFIYDFKIAIVLSCVFIPIYAISRRFVLSGMIAWAFCPLCMLVLGFARVELVTITILSILVLLAHRRNIVEEITRFRQSRLKEIERNATVNEKG